MCIRWNIKLYNLFKLCILITNYRRPEIYKLSVEHNQHWKLDKGDKINSPSNVRFRF